MNASLPERAAPPSVVVEYRDGRPATHASQVTWFVDGALVGRGAARDRMYWEPAPGTHEVVIADTNGRKTRRLLHVEAGTPGARQRS
ncbi:MAG TPA: hypothetical protein VK427_26235 [Kofleriaceae bacterium]|nr:hypothetical protein [Kofleriaceae bacterium]